MDPLMESEYQISTTIVRRVINGQQGGTGSLSFPEMQPMSDDQDTFLNDVVGVINEVGESIDRNPRYRRIVDKFARVVNKENLQKIADKVFETGITWGKIVTLIWVVAKAVKKVVANLVGLVSDIVSWTLNYIKDNLLEWICSVGGWITSIGFLSCYTVQ